MFANADFTFAQSDNPRMVRLSLRLGPRARPEPYLKAIVI